MKAAIKNIDLLAAVNRGLLNLNTSDLTAEEGYMVFRTLKALRKAAEAFEETRMELVRSKVSDEEQEKARAYDEAGDKTAGGLISAEERKAIAGRVAEAGKAVLPLLNDTSEVEVRPVPYPSWFKLKRRNEILTTDMDMLLEGVLWQDGDGERPADAQEEKPKRRR